MIVKGDMLTSIHNMNEVFAMYWPHTIARLCVRVSADAVVQSVQ